MALAWLAEYSNRVLDHVWWLPKYSLKQWPLALVRLLFQASHRS